MNALPSDRSPAPLDLPVMSHAEAIAARNLSRKRAPLVLRTEIGDVSLRLGARDALASWPGAWARLDLLCADRTGALWLPNDLVEAILQGNHPDIDTARIDAADKALLVDAIENELIDRLSRASRAEIAVVSATVHGSVSDPIDFVFLAQPDAGGEPIPLALQCHAVERDRIARAILAMPLQREAFPELKAEIAFRCGHTTISLNEFAELEVGCGISLDDTTLSFQKIVAVVAERFVQSCNWQTIKPTLDGAILKPVDATTIHYTANANVNDQPKKPNPGAPTASVSEVPVHLVFELGRTEIPVAELESLQAGYVFDLGKPLSQTVDILANGHRVGTGELVRLGETIGVRVSRLVR